MKNVRIYNIFLSGIIRNNKSAFISVSIEYSNSYFRLNAFYHK